MYRKQTFLKENIWSDAMQKELLKSYNLERSHLIYNNVGSRGYQYLEITMPYLILYEAVDLGTRKSVYFEFSENGKNMIHSTYEAYQLLSGNALHMHDFYELTFVLSGRLTMQIEEEYISYTAGDCCMCNKNIHHREIMDQDAEIVLFLLKEDFIRNVLDTNYYYDDMGNPHAAGTFFYKLFAENKKMPFYDAKEYIDFRLREGGSPADPCGIINQMILEITGKHSGKSHMMKALLCRFIELLENPERYLIEEHWARLSNEEQVIYRIALAYEKKMGIFSRREIEELTGYNSDYVERIVKKNTGKTLSGYGRDILLTKAALLLAGTDKAVGEICRELNYSNRNYFNQIFIGKYGMTPSAYRKQVQQQPGQFSSGKTKEDVV